MFFLLQAGCVFLASRSLESKDPGILLKLFIHPELKVRGKALQIYKQFLGESCLVSLRVFFKFN